MGFDKNRKHERIEFIQSLGEQERTIYDLSVDGACFHCEKMIQSGKMTQLMINDLTINSKVIYCIEREDGYRVGLEFVELTSEKKTKIKDLVERYSKGVPVSGKIVFN